MIIIVILKLLTRKRPLRKTIVNNLPYDQYLMIFIYRYSYTGTESSVTRLLNLNQ
jgi:hypothetical protein